jgi:hypothetical protein
MCVKCIGCSQLQESTVNNWILHYKYIKNVCKVYRVYFFNALLTVHLCIIL